MKRLTIPSLVRVVSIVGLVTLLIAATSLDDSTTRADKPFHDADQTRDTPPDAQSTTGPVPPASVSVTGTYVARTAETVIIPGIPAYQWHHGCGPTAAGMVIGYWDSHGFDALVSGDAYTQTTAVNEMIASEGPDSNYTDYCEPIDYYPDLFPDLSEPPLGDEHADECVADYMDTSQSYYDNRYGWSWFSDVGVAMEGYSRQVLGPGDDYVFTENLYMLWDSSLNWNRFRTEIDAGRPMVLLVDTDGDDSTDHFVAAVGYGIIDDVRYYACLNTWDSDVHWFEFAPIAEGQAWGIFGGITFRIVPPEWQPYEPIGEIVVPAADKYVRAVEEKDGYAYVLTRDGYLYTYDVSGLSTQQFFTTYDTPIHTQTLSNGNGLLRNGNYIYAFGYNGLEIIDVQNPSTPSPIGSRDDLTIYNLIQHDNYLVATGLEKVAVYSIDAPSSPTWLSDLYIGQGERVWSAAVYSDTLYTYEWTTNWQGVYTDTLSVIDFSDPAHLSALSVMDRDDSAYHLRVVDNQMIECATSHIGLWNLDTPTSPVFQTSQPASARVCAQDGDNIITNGTVFRPKSNVLETVTAFTPGGGQGDGFPYGSTVNSAFVFLAQSKRVLILNAIQPILSVNYTSGSPGSFFTLSGSDFPPNSTVTIVVNGRTLGTLSTDSVGNFVFLLNTDHADEGHYIVTATVNPGASARFVLDSNEPIRPQEGSGTTFDVPSGIAYTHLIYLPLVQKQ